MFIACGPVLPDLLVFLLPRAGLLALWAGLPCLLLWIIGVAVSRR